MNRLVLAFVVFATSACPPAVPDFPSNQPTSTPLPPSGTMLEGDWYRVPAPYGAPPGTLCRAWAGEGLSGIYCWQADSVSAHRLSSSAQACR